MIISKYIDDLSDALQKAGKSEYITGICINYADNLVSKNLPVIFDVNHISKLLGIETRDLYKILYSEDFYYREIDIPKKNGGIRKLGVPSVTLKIIQRWILDNILINIPISNNANGFCKDKSILTNAMKHLNKNCVINMDIKDFFPSISRKTIFNVFFRLGYTKEVAFVLSKLCTYEEILPQGSPASPYLSNIVSLNMDERIQKITNKYNAFYSRYADDITISGNYGIEKCIGAVRQIIQSEGFVVNETKTRIAYKHERQEVTGIVVNNNTPRINNKYKKKLLQEIYFCKKFGVSNHLTRINCDKVFFKEHLYGKAYFIKMVENDTGNRFLDLLDSISWDY